jgi:hypothetical protein
MVTGRREGEAEADETEAEADEDICILNDFYNEWKSNS